VESYSGVERERMGVPLGMTGLWKALIASYVMLRVLMKSAGLDL